MNADIAQLLRHQTYRDLDEHANPLGFYKKPYGDTIYLQVRRPNEPPNLTWFGGCAQSERLWGTRDAQLDSELIERLRAYAPIAKRLLAAPAGVRATETTGPGARLRAAPMLPAWIDESIRYGMGGWTFDKPCGDRATYVQVRAASPCVVILATARDAATPLFEARVLGRALDLDNVDSSDELRSLLRSLGTARLCPGVGIADSDDKRWVQGGFAALATTAVREGAPAMLDRPIDDLVIGTRTGGELLRHVDSAIAGTPAGLRFRADACALVERPSQKWAQRRNGACDRCDPCSDFLKRLVNCVPAAAAAASSTTTPSSTMTSKYMRHDYAAREPEVARAALAAAAARAHAAQSEAARARATRDRAVRRMVSASQVMPATCAITRELTKCFVGLQQTAEYARAFPEGTVRRFIMDDQMRRTPQSPTVSGRRGRAR